MFINKIIIDANNKENSNAIRTNKESTTRIRKIRKEI